MEPTRVSGRISKRTSNLSQKKYNNQMSSQSSNENAMVLNMYKYITNSWPVDENPLKKKICEKTAGILGISVNKLCRILKKNNVDLSENTEVLTTPSKQDKNISEDDNSTASNKIKEGQGGKLAKCSICRQGFKSKMLLEQHLNIHTRYQSLKHYECPLCHLMFAKYEKALEHLHQSHSQEEIANASSIELVHVKRCPICKKIVKSLLMHLCASEETLVYTGQPFLCMVCKRHFYSVKEFDNHTLLVHGDDHEKMFFPTVAEFMKWKHLMEAESSMRNYTRVEAYEGKKFYHCIHVNTSMPQLCPSIVIAQEFQDGVKVTYLDKHSGHKYSVSKLPDIYKKYCITKLLTPTEGYNAINVAPDENDQYLQLKTLLENIVVEAAKINISGLKLLIGKALEMTTVLANYDEETDEHTMDKGFNNLSDAQISDELEDHKRPAESEHDESASKKPKTDTLAPKILNAFSLADSVQIKSESDTESEDETRDVDEEILITNKSKNASKITVDPLSQPLKETVGAAENQPNATDNNVITFNDTYKDFVTKNFIKTYEKDPPPSRPGRRPTMQKIVEFKPIKIPLKFPNETLNPAKITTKDSDVQLNPTKTDLKGPDELLIPIKNATNEPKKSLNPVKMTPKGPGKSVLKTAKITPTDPKKPSNPVKISPKESKTRLNPVKITPKDSKKPMNPDKIDTKDPLNPVKEELSDTTPISSPGSKKVDFEYEVIEQEAGYNILVLKM